ncbi:DUF11 domain-containing protein [Paenibacillus sp. DLE-14]|uniref:DUF11 domain-containing protein n=1 Tax=Paenibacillus lignilyticus TaxID=1172615 RepID=A0ABS5CDR2_9BACL|nr:DUF11 domain-containing protein [Paenibacillus lignilyticus]
MLKGGARSIALVVRATLNATGAITFTGNTLGLSRSTVEGVPGTQDSIGAFVTTNTAVRFGTYPFGTTSNYLLNNSSAILVLPAGSTVLYAELIWGGTYIVPGVNLSAAINNPVTLTLPNSTNVSITPDAATANTFDLGSGAFGYTRSANVTSRITTGGAGTYTVGAVVGTITVTDPTANHAGWTLAVIYQNPALPFRNMSLRVGAVLVQSTSAPVVTTITGFATPVTGALGGRALFSAQEGDANRTGDQALFGPTTGTQVALSGTNNFANNFFASQINDDTGALNTTGTFGTRNQINGAPGSNITGGRQGWDITNVNVSANLANNQSSAVLTLTTSGDAYVVNANALQININAPNISTTKSANVTGTVIGDTITYTVTVSNTGNANAASVVVSDAIPTGSTFVAGSVVVAGVAKPTFDIVAGVPIGSLALNSSVTITYKAKVTSLPNPPQIPNVAKAAFTFQSVAGGDVISGVIPSNTVSTPVYSPVLTLTKSADTTNAAVGTTVTYSVLIANSGSIGATTTFTDNIPGSTTFVPNSVTVNGVTQPGANPVTGVPIGIVPLGGSTTVTFQVIVNSLPTPVQPQISNQAAAAYTYSPPDGSGRTLSGSATSNTLVIPVSLPNVNVVKSSNRTATTVGDTIQFSTLISNNGVAAVSNVVFSDPIPAGTIFIDGSVTVGGVARPTANPAGGISIGTIASGASVNVVFQLSVTSLPSPAQIDNRATVSYSSGTFNGSSLSNSVSVPVYQPIIAVLKSVNSTRATVGDTLTYSFAVQNTGNFGAQLTLTDTLPSGTTYVANSISVDGSPRPGSTPQTGIPVGSVPAGSTVNVSFQVVLQSLPNPPTLTNFGTYTYTYTIPDSRVFNGSGSSNTVSIPASAPNVSISKGADFSEATLNDEITYTIIVSNNSIVPVNQVFVSDPIPDGSQFIAGSVTVGGIPSPSADPAAGILVGTLAPSAISIISFRVRVTSLTTSAVLSNRAAVNYTSGAFMGTAFSDTVNIPVYAPILAVSKSANSAAATLGDAVVYTLQINNSGNIGADVTLTDNIPAGSTFVVNSVIVNGTPQPGVDPVTGIPSVIVPPLETSTVTFQVSVVSLPSPQQLVDQGTAAYTYTLPAGRVVNGATNSNTVTIPVSAPNVSVVLSTPATDITTGDTILYSAVITNNGITNVNNIIYVGTPIPGTAFVPGSVTVNGIALPQADVTAGIPIGSLAPSAFATVTYEVKLIMPVSDQIVNQSTVSFTSGSFSSTSSSNVVTTPITQPQINVVKSAGTSSATVGDTIVYTIAVSNTGNLPATVTVTDTIPANTTFVANSVIVGGIPQPSATPSGGINAGTVDVNQTVYLMFSVVIDSLPNPQQIVNQATATYQFTPPDGRLITGTSLSNSLSISVSSPNVNVFKSSTATSVSIGDTIPYIVLVSNNGIAPITNTVFIDGIPSGTVFVSGSVAINSVPVPGANPALGVNVGTIPSGGTATVTFSLLVVSVPTPPLISNQASVTYTSGAFASSSFSNGVDIPVYQPVISVVKSASTTNASVGQTVIYTMAVANSGNYAASVILSDPTLAPELSFVPNSVIVGGSPQAGADPITGIPVGVVQPGATVNVTFTAVITSLPPSQQLSNQATAAYSYTLPDSRTLNGSSVSNTLSYPVSSPDVDVVKSATRTALTVGDIQTYSILVTNSGISTVDNIIFADPIPAGTSFLSGSVTINGVPLPNANPAAGFSLDPIAAGASVTVAFSVTVTAVPEGELVSNRSSVSFTSGVFSAVTFSNTVTTPVYQPVITLDKSANTSLASVGNTVVYRVNVTNSGNYPTTVTITDPTPTGTSLVPNSVIVSGAPQAGADPAAGYSIGVVAPGATVQTTFEYTINTMPPNQQLTNQATASYAFTLPDSRSFIRSAASNTLTIPVTSPNISIVKSTLSTDAIIGDVITYSNTVTNTGIANLNSAVLSDPVPAGTTFVPGSVAVNGVPFPNANPASGIALGVITPSSSVTVTFDITVNSLPASGQLNNQSTVSFTSGVFSGTGLSNVLTTPVYNPIMSVVKSASTANATVGDTITYSLLISNTGNLEATVILYDTIPAGAEFIPNSVAIGGVPQPGADPVTGINVGVVPAGASVHVLVTLQVTVEALPSPQQLANQATAAYSFSPPDGRIINATVNSNTVIIPVSSPDVSVVKSSNAIDAVVGDTIIYTITVTNNGLSPVNNVTLVDPLPPSASFIPGTVTVNGVPMPADSPNTGIHIGTIAVGAVSTVQFQVLVV